MNFAFFMAAYSYVVAHQSAFYAGAFAIIVLASVLNRLVPGHPALAGFARKAVALLAFTPMVGARSAIFAAIAGKLGPTVAGDIFDALSKYVDLPILSTSVTPSAQLEELKPPRGVAPINSLVAIVAMLSLSMIAIGCASVFGATAKRDVRDCGEASLKAAAVDVAPQVSNVLTGGKADWTSSLGALEAQAGDAVLCAVAALVRDFEMAHAAQQPHALMSATAKSSSPEPLEMAAERGRYYLAGRPVPVQPIAP